MDLLYFYRINNEKIYAYELNINIKKDILILFSIFSQKLFIIRNGIVKSMKKKLPKINHKKKFCRYLKQ